MGFGLYDPETAQRHLFVEQYIDLLGRLNFIHHSESKVLMRDIFNKMGSGTYFHVPILLVRSIGGFRSMIFS